ncbi:interleukin-6 receptor subunit beta isoform X2 [Hippocampus zosterae]|uniref:interleukin-6 receptor subunit beta isoform X2 n=1 Tax=Hippocampus zosterae TaxID=109293 RepID=UPI00223E3130|nr:interleukin-6 receptor subunit beta isoform X2 [Hippocampus zosterae]
MHRSPIMTMVLGRRLLLFALACLASSSSSAETGSHLVITPQSPVLQIGTNFTATCVIIGTTEVTADDLYWNLSQIVIPSNQYTKINESALSVTIPVDNEESEWLYCHCKETSSYVFFNKGKFVHGIHLTKVYHPEKPKNLTCIALQGVHYMSKDFKCSWEPPEHHIKEMPTTYTLHAKVIQNNQAYNVSTQKNTATVTMETFPFHLDLEIWVVADNQLGTVESEHLKQEATSFAKTNPPSSVEVFSEESFPTSLLINWKHPIPKQNFVLKYQIRYCLNGSHNWISVPMVLITKDAESFRLQNLQPDTVYTTQVRCKHVNKQYGYWSNWSANVTEKTHAYRPTSKPDLWHIITEGESVNERQVKFICKNPVLSNGKITGFKIKIQTRKDDMMNRSMPWDNIPVKEPEVDSFHSHKFTVLKEMTLPDNISARVYVTAINSAGESPQASFGIPERALDLDPVEGFKVDPQGDTFFLKWNPPKKSAVTQYVVQWVSANGMDWQRENKTTQQTTIKGNIEKFICYNISVYPIYSGWTGKPARVEAYLEERAPLVGPSVRLNGKPGRNQAELVWNEIPQHQRQGFITNYTIFYSSGSKRSAITVPATNTSYVLTSLSANTKYDAWIRASTNGGSTDGTNHSFTTLKYAPGEIEMIVVGVSLGFLFVVLLTMLLCIYKKDVIRKNLWPWIPNPRKSTIGNWSPDYPLKTETPKENFLSGISVLDVDVSDGKSVSEEDKTSLALKKDKYLSEEHSSGIGGSSCMSSPRQSVSDSDEGADIADTTASTVQYSSVVASNGYKGQTPSAQPQQLIFSRSESTQPLLDSEENPDLLVQEGSRASQPFSQVTCFSHSAWNQDNCSFPELNQLEVEPEEVLLQLDMCPSGEDSEQKTLTDGQSLSSYMPQLGGYRPQ